MEDHTARDVVAPRSALAWASGTADRPGRWLYDEVDVTWARERGERVRHTETDAHTQRTLVREVSGHAPLADLMRLTSDIDALRVALVDLAEAAAARLTHSDE